MLPLRGEHAPEVGRVCPHGGGRKADVSFCALSAEGTHFTAYF
ncbi:hypothetical protein WJR50_19250 [Catalinimonas sp. 4WD22]